MRGDTYSYDSDLKCFWKAVATGWFPSFLWALLVPVTQLVGSRRGRCFKQPPALHFPPGICKLVMPHACPPLHSLPLNTPPRSTVCITEPRSAAPLQKISTGIPVPSCHRGSDSSLHLGQGLLKGHSRAGRVGGRHTHQTGREGHAHAGTTNQKGSHPRQLLLHQMLSWQELGLCIDPPD